MQVGNDRVNEIALRDLFSFIPGIGRRRDIGIGGDGFSSREGARPIDLEFNVLVELWLCWKDSRRRRTLRFFADGRDGDESGRSSSEDSRRSAGLRRALRLDGGILFVCRRGRNGVLQSWPFFHGSRARSRDDQTTRGARHGGRYAGTQDGIFATSMFWSRRKVFALRKRRGIGEMGEDGKAGRAHGTGPPACKWW